MHSGSCRTGNPCRIRVMHQTNSRRWLRMTGAVVALGSACFLVVTRQAFGGGDPPAIDAEAKLRAVIGDFIESVKKHDVPEILKAIRDDGLTCGDSSVPKKKIEGDL